MNEKLKWSCKKNHKWKTSPHSINKGSWCPKCKKERKLEN